jgi:RNA polymerase sigma-70 factor (ECF subfamily)
MEARAAAEVPAFREIYDAHVPFVWRALRRLGVRESDAADAVQDVFVVVHRRLSEFDPRARITTWLFAICMRVASARRRAAHVRLEVSAEELPISDVPDEGADAGAVAEHNQKLDIVEAILDQMPMEQRAAFSLFELEGMTGEAIAELLDVSVNTVHSRVRLARQAFRQSLAQMQARERFLLRRRA